ncbi:JmjC domain-containing protein [Leptothermofonsia sp. ETS-13]|uniref:JmjC domain-containing protein n=1 Tax=Leptothermofonsia sp. ETS-13 TaxID=3035696 RepID=UPI003BA312D1
METLKSLLAPYPVDQFLVQNWTQQGVHIPAKNPQKFQTLFSWKTLNHLLNFHRLSYPDLRFTLDEKTLPAIERREWRDRLQQGATMIIDSIHELVPEVASLVAGIRYETGHRAQVNLYCSPAEQQGFDCHYDTHDVLVLQIDGEKEWFVFGETIPYPIADIRSPDQLPPDEPPYLKSVLQPGDVLYIPRGHWHYAIARDRPSLHLTLGIDCQIGLDWLDWLLRELQNQPEWRQNLPLILNGDVQAVQKRLEKLSQNLANQIIQPEWQQKYVRYLTSQAQPVAPFSLPFQLGSGIFDHGLETRFYRDSTQPVQIETSGDDEYQVTVGSKQVLIKHVPDQLVKNLFNRNSFTILDMADWAPDLDLEADVVPLLTQLVTTGVLFVH